MKTLFKILFFGAALLSVAALLGGVGLWHTHHPLDWSVTFNGDDWTSASEGGDASELGDWLGAGLGLCIAAVALAVVLPVVLLLGLALPLLILGGVLAAILVSVSAALLGIGAVLTSPVLLIGLGLFIVLRSRQRHRADPRTVDRPQPSPAASIQA